MEQGEDVVLGEVRLGKGVRRREPNVWFPSEPNVGGVSLRVALVCMADRR